MRFFHPQIVSETYAYRIDRTDLLLQILDHRGLLTDGMSIWTSFGSASPGEQREQTSGEIWLGCASGNEGAKCLIIWESKVIPQKSMH